MNWEAIGAFAELLGGVGVIVTLVYLAHQIRQNTQSNRTSVIQLTSDQETAFWQSISRDEQIADILLRGNRDLSSLSEVESARFAAVMMNLFRFWQNQFELYREGSMPETLWSSSRSGIVATLSNAGVRSWWKYSAHMFTDELRGVVDDILREQGSSNGA